MSSHDQYVSSRTRSRRPALIPASAFNNLESTDDLSSILPNVVHGSGCVYLLPPAGPPPELALQIRLEQSLRPPMTREYSSGSNTDMDVDSEWATSGSVTPVAASQSRIRRWSMKDLVEPDRDSLQESQFETPKQFIHKRQTSGVSEDLFSWVNSSSDAEHGVRQLHLDGRVITDLDSLPTSPLSSTSKPDVQRQLQRLQEASRMLHGL